MKKEIIICVVVILIILILNNVTENHTEIFIDEIEIDLENLRDSIMTQDEKEMKEKINTVIEKWKNEHEMFAMYIEHNELEKIEIYFCEIKSYIETKEYNMAIQGIDTSIFLMNHVKDRYKLALRNIF